jgi:hypothetical protein
MAEEVDTTIAMAEPTYTELRYPRPGLRRERWTDLCGTWEFGFDDQNVGVCDRWFAPTPPPAYLIERSMCPFPPRAAQAACMRPVFIR